MTKPDKAKAKVVLIVGNDLPMEEIQKEFAGHEDEIIFIGNGEKVSQEMDLNSIQGRTDENTLFILYAHGWVSGKAHGPTGSNISTESFLKKLKDTADHKITVTVESCRVGGIIKRSELGSDDICVLAESGSNYQSLTEQNTKAVIQSISQKLSGKTNMEIISYKIGSRPETLYFLPFANEVVSDLEFKSDSNSVAKANRKGYKFSRPGKFSLDEIKQILESVDVETKDISANDAKRFIERRLEEFRSTKKSDFSINKIKQIITVTIYEEELLVKLSEKLQNKFREKLLNKLSEPEIKTFFKNRQNNFNEIVKINNPVDSEKINYKENVIADFWFLAALRGYEEEILAILKIYPDFINKENDQKFTALKYAAESGRYKVVHELIKAGANVNWVDKDKQSALMYAAANDQSHFIISSWYTQVVQELIKAGANINLIDKDGKSALDWAIEKEHWETTAELIKAGANLDKIDINKLIRSALKDNHSEIIIELIKVKANLDKIDIDKLIKLAIGYRCYEAVIELIKAGVKTDGIEIDGEPLLRYALDEDLGEILIELFKAGAIDDQKFPHGRVLSYFINKDNITAVKELIKAGININWANKDGNSALMLAIKNDNSEIAMELLQAGADVNLVDKNGKSVLMQAIENENIPDGIIMHLIKVGADVDLIKVKIKGFIIKDAAKAGEFEVVKKLLNGGAPNIEKISLIDFEKYGKERDEEYDRSERYREESNQDEKDSSKKEPKEYDYKKTEELVKSAAKSGRAIYSYFKEFSSAKKIKTDIVNVIHILEENKSKYGLTCNYFDLQRQSFLDSPDKPQNQNDSDSEESSEDDDSESQAPNKENYQPMISFLLSAHSDAEIIKLLNDNLDLFVSEKNLNKKDYKGQTPLSIAIHKAASATDETQEQLIQIAAKLITKMNLAESDVNALFSINKKGENKKKIDLVIGKVNQILKSKNTLEKKSEKPSVTFHVSNGNEEKKAQSGVGSGVRARSKSPKRDLQESSAKQLQGKSIKGKGGKE